MHVSYSYELHASVCHVSGLYFVRQSYQAQSLASMQENAGGFDSFSKHS